MNEIMCGKQVWKTLLLNSDELFLHTSTILKYVYKTKIRGTNAVITVTSKPKMLLMTVVTHDSLAIFQIAQYTLQYTIRILLSHKGSRMDKT